MQDHDRKFGAEQRFDDAGLGDEGREECPCAGSLRPDDAQQLNGCADVAERVVRRVPGEPVGGGKRPKLETRLAANDRHAKGAGFDRGSELGEPHDVATAIAVELRHIWLPEGTVIRMP